MALSEGSRLGVYRITAFIAAGGMGGVYEAVHTELGRRVAIKVLADEIAADPTSLERFRREAKAASSLMHPHICTVYDFGQANGTPFLVFEYVEGETLAERLRRRRLPIADVIRYATQIADAIHHAHERGLVHRDLKPANVMLTETGAKVLDFGLAKRGVRRPPLAEAGGEPETDEAGDSTLTSLTREDTIVGTLPYMAPEQVEGGEIDWRTDIYAIGAVIYEMITGRPPVHGRTNAALLADILQGEPTPIPELAPSAPPALVHLVERCLRKNPAERWQDARDLAIELNWLADQRSGEAPAAAGGGSLAPRFRLRWLGAVIGATAIAAVIGLVVAGDDGRPTGATRLLRFGISPPAGVVFTAGARNVPTVSPDGDRIAFVGTDREGETALWIRSLDDPQAQRVRGSEQAVWPFWSPDGAAIGFFSRGQVRIARLPDGPSQTITAARQESAGGGGATWNADDIILFASGSRSGLYAVPGNGGAHRSVTQPDRDRGEIGHVWPQFLPDGRHFLYFVTSALDSVRGIYVASLDRTSGRRIAPSSSSGVFAEGHLLYVRERTLLAQPFSLETLSVRGAAVPVVDSVATTYAAQSGVSVSRQGVLAYWSDVSKDLRRLVWLDRQGGTVEVVGPPRHYRNPSLSRDGRQLALDVFEGADRDLFVMELGSGRERRLRDWGTSARDPVWAPDGLSLAFAAERARGWILQRLEVHGAEPPATVLGSQADRFPTQWSPDGRLIVYAEFAPRGGWNVLAVPADGGGEPVPLLDDAYDEVNARLSPSGHLLAFQTSESGHDEVYVEPFPATGLRCQLSSGGGWDPQWGEDDRRLYYLDPNGTLMTVDVQVEEGCDPGRPSRLFATEIGTPATARNHYVVSPDGERFLFNLPVQDPRTQTIEVIVNWPAALRATDP